MALAGRAGLPDLVAEHVRPGGECGVNAHLKVPALVAGMAAGADPIDDMDLLRHGAMSTHTKIQGKSPLVRGLNALAAVISTPIAAPVIAATRLRGGNAASAWHREQEWLNLLAAACGPPAAAA